MIIRLSDWLNWKIENCFISDAYRSCKKKNGGRNIGKCIKSVLGAGSKCIGCICKVLSHACRSCCIDTEITAEGGSVATTAAAGATTAKGVTTSKATTTTKKTTSAAGYFIKSRSSWVILFTLMEYKLFRKFWLVFSIIKLFIWTFV